MEGGALRRRAGSLRSPLHCPHWRFASVSPTGRERRDASLVASNAHCSIATRLYERPRPESLSSFLRHSSFVLRHLMLFSLCTSFCLCELISHEALSRRRR